MLINFIIWLLLKVFKPNKKCHGTFCANWIHTTRTCSVLRWFLSILIGNHNRRSQHTHDVFLFNHLYRLLFLNAMETEFTENLEVYKLEFFWEHVCSFLTRGKIHIIDCIKRLYNFFFISHSLCHFFSLMDCLWCIALILTFCFFSGPYT